VKIEKNREIPFYANTPEDTRCVQACSRMILKYLLDREFSWEELDDLMQSGAGEATSPVAALTGMTKLGLQTALITDFDHLRFSREGIGYIRHMYGNEIADWQLANGDVEKGREISRSLFSSSVLYECRSPELDDIKTYQEAGYIIFCGINSKAINDENGYAGHSIVVLDIEDTVRMHDPGLPPRPYREVPIQQFVQAWKSRGANIRAVRLPE